MISYINILKAVILRANQTKNAVDAAELELNFQGEAIDNLDGLEVPFSAFKLAILASEKRLVGLVGRSANQLLRSSLIVETAPIASGDLVRSVNEDGAELFGTLSGFYDSENGQSLTEQPQQVVDRYNRNSGSFYKLDKYYFAWVGQRLYHTRNFVVGDAVGWNADEQNQLFDLPVTSLTDKDFTNSDLSSSTDKFTISSHSFFTGLRVRFVKGSPSNDLPSPLVENQDYFINVVSATQFYICATLQSALFGIPINLTTTGTGTNTIEVQPILSGGGSSPLHAEMETLFIADVLANLAIEGWFVNESQIYAGLVAKGEQQILSGVIPSIALPSATSHADPVKN